MAVPEVEKLDQLRKEVGYSQEELVRTMDIPLATYVNWLYRGAEPNYQSLKTIQKWTEALKEVANGDRKRVPTSENLKEENSNNVEVVDFRG